jgi:hypothetical protein
MTGTLIDLIDRLSEVDVSDRFNPPIIYSEGGPNASTKARAIICPAPDDGLECPLDPTLTEVLMVSLAQEAIRVWGNWRHRTPNRLQKFEAVMYYARNDAFFPLEGNG